MPWNFLSLNPVSFLGLPLFCFSSPQFEITDLSYPAVSHPAIFVGLCLLLLCGAEDQARKIGAWGWDTGLEESIRCGGGCIVGSEILRIQC